MTRKKYLNNIHHHLLQYHKNTSWTYQARPKQRIPKGDWFIWLILAGRGFGKTRTGAETVRSWALSGQYKRMALVGHTYDEAVRIMVEGDSGLLNVHREQEKPHFIPSKGELLWPSGARAYIHSASNIAALRGPQFDAVWVDELAKFSQPNALWDQLMMGLRLSQNPRMIITTTPRPIPLLDTIMKRKDVHLTQGKTTENARHLSPYFLRNALKTYGDTVFGMQELDGIYTHKSEGGLWSKSLLTKVMCQQPEHMDRMIVSVDPARTSHENSDETGIIVLGKSSNMLYIMDDYSGRFTCQQWIQRVQEACSTYNIRDVLVEDNALGDVGRHLFHIHAPDLLYIPVTASQSKTHRAIAVHTLYQSGGVLHTQPLPTLEEQMLNFGLNHHHDDRVDALCWGVHHLCFHQDSKPTPSAFHSWKIS